MMTPAEHYREAERLLELAAANPVIVNAPDNISQEQADALETVLRDRFPGVAEVLVMPDSMRVDATGIVAAAQVHATLAVAGSQMRSLGIEDE
jgi:hypothetical protein